MAYLDNFADSEDMSSTIIDWTLIEYGLKAKSAMQYNKAEYIKRVKERTNVEIDSQIKIIKDSAFIQQDKKDEAENMLEANRLNAHAKVESISDGIYMIVSAVGNLKSYTRETAIKDYYTQKKIEESAFLKDLQSQIDSLGVEML